MEVTHDPISYLLGGLAAALFGLSKTGLPGVSIPSVLLMTEAFSENAKLAVGACLPVLLLGDFLAVARYRHHAQWSRLVRLFPYVALGMVPGWLVLRQLEANQLRPVIGALVVLLIAVEVARRWFRWEHVPRSWWFVVLTGLLAGFATTVAHAAFPVMSIYLLSQAMPKRQFIGTAAWFFLLLNLTKLPLYVAEGMITPAVLRFDAVIAPALLLGAALGVYLLTRIPQRMFDVLAFSLAGVAAVRLMVA